MGKGTRAENVRHMWEETNHGVVLGHTTPESQNPSSRQALDPSIAPWKGNLVEVMRRPQGARAPCFLIRTLPSASGIQQASLHRWAWKWITPCCSELVLGVEMCKGQGREKGLPQVAEGIWTSILLTSTP